VPLGKIALRVSVARRTTGHFNSEGVSIAARTEFNQAGDNSRWAFWYRAPCSHLLGRIPFLHRWHRAALGRNLDPAADMWGRWLHWLYQNLSI